MRVPSALALAAVCASGCATDAPTRAELRAVQDGMRRLQDDNARLAARLQELELDRAAGRLGPAASPSAPGTSATSTASAPAPRAPAAEVPSLTVVKLKPKVDRAPPLDTKTAFQEPDPELVAALARSPAAPAGADAPPDALQLEGEFQQASEALRTGNLSGGVERMRRFADAHPRDPRADDALYLAALGELGQDEPARAAKLLETALQRYPAGDVVQQAMLKLAECRLRLKQTPEARALLARLVTNFPGTPAATEAQARLSRIPRTP